MTDHLEIAKLFIKDRLRQKQWFKQIVPHLKSIVLSPASHIEILLYMPRAAVQQYTVGSYEYVDHNVTVHVLCRSIEKVRDIAKGPTSAQVQFYTNCAVLWRGDEEYVKLAEKITGKVIE
jgi:hypothetical protein